MKTNVDQFIALRGALQKEQAIIEARLNVIARALGESTPASTAAATPGKRIVSAATKAKMRAAQQARWAKMAKPAAKTVAPRKKVKFSPEGLARIKAAQKARWAKINAEKAAKLKK